MAVAVAPNPAISAIPDGKEGDSVRLTLELDDHGARYDSLTYSWSVDGSQDDFNHPTAASPTWTRPDVNSDTEITVRCDVTAHGNGHNADAGTSATRSDTDPATVLQVPDAVAPTGVVRTAGAEGGFIAIPNLFERDAIRVGIDFSDDGTNDYIDYEWTLVNFEQGHRGTVFQGAFDDPTDAAPILTLPSVGGNTSVYVRCVVTAHGRNNTTRRGTTHVRTMTDAHFTILDYPDAQAPSFTVDGVTNGLSNSRIGVSVTPSGGRYDSIEYKWSCWVHGSGGGVDTVNDIGPHVFDDRTSRTPTWTRPSVTSNTVYVLRCTVTVRGADGDAEAGTTATDHADINTTVLPLPDADAPSGSLSVARGPMRSRVVLNATFNGGTYDRLTYDWYVSRVVEQVEHAHPGSLSGRTLENPTWTRPDVSPDDQSLPFFIRLTFQAHGDGVNAQRGTSDQGVVSNNQIRVDYVNVMEQTDGFGVYVTDEHGNEIQIDAMFPNAQESG